MRIAYKKMHGAGNRIVVVDARKTDVAPPSAEQIRMLGDDVHGPGFDQLMWIGSARNAASVASYRVFNNDGSEVEQCGNGVRCVARVLAPESGNEFALDSPAGPVDIRLGDNDRIAVSMGTPQFEQSTLQVNDRILDVALVHIGNPHCVLLVDDASSAEVGSLGPAIENHERFPDRINVGFMKVRDSSSIDLRVHERGVGETLACGTGACAAVVAGRELGLLEGDVEVFLPGGRLVVSWRGGADTVWLSGDAETLSEGIIDL